MGKKYHWLLCLQAAAVLGVAASAEAPAAVAIFGVLFFFRLIMMRLGS